jgi:peptidoglycan/LPS O-acetylase OafA/YrhL
MSPEPHIKVLDGLRALAISLILIQHATVIMWTDRTHPILAAGTVDLGQILLLGFTGVYLFFILSGFLIAQQLYKADLGNTVTRRTQIQFFFRKRFFRLAPAYYLTLSLVFLMPWFGTHTTECYVAYLAFLQDYICSSYSPIFWSLAVEFQFYLIAPFLILAALLSRRPELFIGMALAAFMLLRVILISIAYPNTSTYERYFFDIAIPCHIALSTLLSGMFCATLWQNETIRLWLSDYKRASILLWGGIAIIFLVFALNLDFYDAVTLKQKIAFLPSVTVGFCCMMLGLLGGGAGYRIFQTHPLQWLAMISYSLYLVHFFILFVFERLIRPVHGLWQINLLLSLGFCFGAAILLYFLVEQPFIEWAKRKSKPH